MTYFSSYLLTSGTKNRRIFDVNSKVDIEEVRFFIQNNNKWKNGCPFFLEFPYLTIPDMIKDMIVKNYLKDAA